MYFYPLDIDVGREKLRKTKEISMADKIFLSLSIDWEEKASVIVFNSNIFNRISMRTFDWISMYAHNDSSIKDSQDFIRKKVLENRYRIVKLSRYQSNYTKVYLSIYDGRVRIYI